MISSPGWTPHYQLTAIARHVGEEKLLFGLLPSDSPTYQCMFALCSHLNIEIRDLQRVLFDELAARFHGIAHQSREDIIRRHHILDAYLH